MIGLIFVFAKGSSEVRWPLWRSGGPAGCERTGIWRGIRHAKCAARTFRGLYNGTAACGGRMNLDPLTPRLLVSTTGATAAVGGESFGLIDNGLLIN